MKDKTKEGGTEGCEETEKERGGKLTELQRRKENKRGDEMADVKRKLKKHIYWFVRQERG